MRERGGGRERERESERERRELMTSRVPDLRICLFILQRYKLCI